VLVSAASNNLPPMSVSAPFTLDASSTNTQGGSIILAHASLEQGTYTMTVTYSPWNDPTSMAIGVVLYVFPNAS
jgi:hypothetical protein